MSELSRVVTIPVEPSENLLYSMAMRYRHDFGIMEEDMQKVILTTMRQIHEEVVGVGFYHYPEEP